MEDNTDYPEETAITSEEVFQLSLQAKREELRLRQEKEKEDLLALQKKARLKNKIKQYISVFNGTNVFLLFAVVINVGSILSSIYIVSNLIMTTFTDMQSFFIMLAKIVVLCILNGYMVFFNYTYKVDYRP